ncbi:hypothetical protein Vretimale_1759 [Volvox reticuliferus]|uniref:Uncharacterized protein n=1 Tax=Volvox reticuliferus TaxID=1737510 RepID=A0A8J4D546_9CHLO|nr:hypothetical protein Vretimale_1759 [Volvox reticuliferus]
MDGQYDSMYDAIPPFSFGHCLPYQDMENEWSMFRGTVVLDCAGTGRHWVPQEGSLLMWGRMQGSRELDGSGSSTTGDMSCGSSTTSSSDGDRSGRSTADGWCYIIHDGGVSNRVSSSAAAGQVPIGHGCVQQQCCTGLNPTGLAKLIQREGCGAVCSLSNLLLPSM